MCVDVCMRMSICVSARVCGCVSLCLHLIMRICMIAPGTHALKQFVLLLMVHLHLLKLLLPKDIWRDDIAAALLQGL